MSNFASRQLRRSGWKIIDNVEMPKKCVICLAPHTSNWDFIWGLLYKHTMHIRANFFMKKEWFRFPLGKIMRSLGGVPVNRAKKSSLTDVMAAEFANHDEFRLAITPEGTRKHTETWKLGFYFIALKAQVPIVLAKIDYQRKELGCGEIFYPTGDVDVDMVKIRAYYQDVMAKKPKNFAG